MNICNLIDPKSLVYGMISGFVLGTCAYCIWNGRKVMEKWTENEKPIPVPWSRDDNNPANWYLKDPNKFKVTYDDPTK